MGCEEVNCIELPKIDHTAGYTVSALIFVVQTLSLLVISLVSQILILAVHKRIITDVFQLEIEFATKRSITSTV
jgi:hypothetical protein